MSDSKNWVMHIRKEIEDSRKVRLWQDSINMLGTVSESIFSRSAHFILELLQNAEDAGSKLGARRGEIEFHISPTRIKVIHNGSPFNYENVNAICGVRSTKKPEEDTLGYLGIGFKSVFKVSDCPQIHSGDFHFKFDKSVSPNPANEPWQITPIWIDAASESLNPTLTTFIMPFRNSEAYEQTLQELQKLNVHIFLFLKWLRRLRILIEPKNNSLGSAENGTSTDSQEQSTPKEDAEEKNLSEDKPEDAWDKWSDEIKRESTLIENLGETNGVVSLKKDNQTHRFVIFRRISLVPPEVAKDTSLEFYKRQKVKQREIVLAFGVDDKDNLQPIEDASALGSVSSFLPLVEERSGVKFLIQSDFLVQPGREAIQYELSWNKWLIGEAAELTKEAIEEFKKHPKWKEQFLPILSFKSYWGQLSFEKLFRPVLHQPLLDYLKTTQIYPTLSGHHVNPSHAVQLEEAAKGLVEDNDLSQLFPGGTDLHLAATNLDTKSIPEEVQSQVKKLDLGRIARNKQFLEKKVKQPDHVQWFIQLYKAMADMHQDYKEQQGRDSRGRIKYYDSPIYILTEKDAIISAQDCHLRQIADEVLKLRAKYPQVGALLSSYQLIHPDLDIPELTDFFKQRTHVQPIDYGKICREVFIPKVKVDAKAPPKNELIAYTRLLQKGPEIQDTIWVVTKKNDKIVPSNQVFLGAPYSPSENWEKLSMYSPQIEFLSEEYLQGVPQKQIHEWKSFVLRIGCKESGEKPEVDKFSIHFIKENLAGELQNFVDKSYKQFGYDLEAIQTQTGLIVKLESKGRKKEDAIDLEGNEPTTAQQSKLNNELFWVCIVTGIPENPQLWVVEDPTSIGVSNTLTLPLSVWKKHGRRVI